MRAVAPTKCWPKTVTDPVFVTVLEDRDMERAAAEGVDVGGGVDFGLVFGPAVAEGLTDGLDVGTPDAASTWNGASTTQDVLQHSRMW